MKQPLIALAVAGLLSAAPLAMADEQERVDHFEAKSSETLVEAVANFTEYNEKLAAILEKDELSDEDMGNIHQLSYTIEEALAKIHTDLEAVAATLEEVHIGSETGDYEGVKANGEAYLKTAWTVVR
ncbi:DUF6746 family protein [Halomonas sp. NO4]|uniref:DUF6746 family protein n=1 Tax=Halomonas sp. NO4 TaxID=2484813 RepID=UPI0013D21156|nr:DUF6746 family protein [Halomonas sp. NO4]